jgi:HTH-type transcriptional regulator / antitoxin HigA
MKDILPIHTHQDYTAALGEVNRLLALDDTHGLAQPELDRLEVISILVADYEDRTDPVPHPSPAEAIRFRMEQLGLRQKDLVPYMKTESRVSEVLSGKRLPTLEMIARLHKGLGIPLKSLLPEVV